MNYYEILNLQKEPFSNSPEPDFFFESDEHIHCLQKLELAIRLRRGLNIVMGDVGTGKTTLCRRLILQLSARPEDRGKIETHLILDPQFASGREFLVAVTLLMGLPTPDEGDSEWRIKENIKSYLFTRGVDEGKIVVLLIDEGQKLPDFCLEILREFLNYETNEYKLLQIVIFAQRELAEILKKHKNFSDRVNQFHYLSPLDFRNTKGLIEYRLQKAAGDGIPPKLFTKPSLWAIYRATGGYPRRINTLCHQLILSMLIQNKKKVHYSLVRACAFRVTLPERSYLSRRVLILGTLLAFLIFAFFQLGPGKEILSHGKYDLSSSTRKIETPSPQPVPKTVEEQTKTPPSILGEITVRRGEALLPLMRRLFGDDAKRLLPTILAANPRIDNPDRIREGERLIIPARRPKSSPSLPSGKYYVQVARFPELAAAEKFLKEKPIKHRLFLLPYWNATDGLSFAILLPEGYPNEQAAQRAKEELPEGLINQAQIIQGWPRGTLFL